MNSMTKFAMAGALLAALAVPAYAAKDMANEDSGAKVKQGKKPHGGMSGKKGKPHGGMMGGMMGGRDMIATFDADGDGRVTQAEVDDYRGNRLAKFDTDGNASLTLSEYEALWLADMREKMVDRFQDLDADGDAVVTAEEFKRPYANLVRHMDRNGDGVLTREHEKKEEKEEPNEG